MGLIISEPPLQVLPSLAVELGSVDEAIILQQVHYWLQRSKNIREGHRWIYNSMADWMKQFPWIKSRKTMTKYFNDLEDRGLIITGNYNKKAFDKTKWYRINYPTLSQMEQRLGKVYPTNGQDLPNGMGKDYPTNTNRLPETTPDILSQSNSELPKIDIFSLRPGGSD